MKKIFAFVLASLMVLSLVPASAFAAVTKCPATHTSTNCDATLLYTAVADCENVGYQAYVCNDCGAQFMDNLKPKTNHAWVSNPELASADIAASCIYKTNGVQHLICKNCDEEWAKPTNYNSVDVHQLTLVSGVGCEKLYQCALCDAKGYMGKDADGNAILAEEVSHTWEFTKIVEEPAWVNGTANKGKALFSCKDCVATKQVDINTPFCHESNNAGSVPPEDYVVVVSPNNKACDVKGHYLVVKCPDCAELWYCTSQTCATTHKEFEDHTWACADTDNDGKYNDTHAPHDAADKNTGVHEFPAISHNGSSGKVCGESYYCDICYTWQVKGHSYTTIDGTVVPAKCGVKGYRYEKCTCGNVRKKTLDALKHDEATVTLPATCASPARTFKICKRGTNCTIKPTIIDGATYRITNSISYVGNINADAHNFDPTVSGTIDIGNINPELYCSGITYTYKLCLNGCAEYGTGNPVMTDPVLHDLYVSYYAHNFSKADGGFAAHTALVGYSCKKCSYVSEKKPVTDTEFYKYSFTSVEEALVFFGYLKSSSVYVPSTKEIVTTYALRMNYESYGTVAALIADTTKFQAMYSTPATCQTAGSITYALKDWGTYVTIETGKLPHIPGQTIPGKEPTCVTPGTYTTHVCKNCGVTYWELEGKQYTTSPVKNPCANLKTDANPTGTLEFVAGSCGDKNGYYKCTICKTCYTDATCATKYVPTLHTYTTLIAGVPATCNTVGIPEVRYCSICKALEVNVIYMNGGEEVRVNFAPATAKYGTSTVAVDFVLNGENLLSAEVLATIDAEGNVTFSYADDTWVEWPTAVNVKKMEGSSYHRGLYLINEPELVSETESEKILASGIVLSTEVKFEKSEHGIFTDFDELDHTKPYFELVYCDACVFEYITTYTAAQGGHVNDKGNLITDDCADGAKGGRECLTCKAYYQNKAIEEGFAADYYAEKYTFGAHTLVDVSAETGFTCQSAGYDAQLCTKCNLYIVDPDSYEPADAAKYHKSIKEKVEAALESNDFWDLLAIKKYEDGNDADYAQNGLLGYVCDVCAAQIIAPKATPCPGTGIEINMSTEYDEYMPNAYIELVISLDSLKGVNAWGLNFSVGYNPELVKFVSADFSASPFATNKANDVYGLSYTQDTENQMVWHASTKKVAYGIVSIASSSTEGVAIKGNNEYVTLTFQVIEARGQAQFEIGYIIPAVAANRANPAYSIYSANAVGANGKSINLNYNVSMKESMAGVEINNKTHTVDTLAFLDFDADGELTIFDAFELYYLIETDEYDVLADADHDGDVDTDDLDILYAVLVGEKTLKDILAEKEVEEEERVIKYDEEGFVVYDSLYDFNDDGVLSAYEIAVMTGKIDADLNPNT